MKRKLNEDDVPTPAEELKQSQKGFESLGLDSRLLQAVSNEGFKAPTPVQSQTIPLALGGKDILARAKTGTGKTAAYLLPILESILRRKQTNSRSKSTAALILVPTRELADQVSKAVTTFSAYCAKEIRTVNLTQKTSDDVQKSLLAELPDVVVATPARAWQNISNSALSLETLTHLVVDEADLVLSYGYEEDVQNLAKAVPPGVQTMLMSATLTTEVESLKGLFCKDPVILALDDPSEEDTQISQYMVRCGEDEKFLLLYVIFKLKLVKGKCIIFVGDIDRCYRLKLFLEQFGIKSCVLNSELPVNSRIHVVEEFNKNVYDIIIAADEHEVLDTGKRQIKKKELQVEDDGDQKMEDAGEVVEEVVENPKKKRKAPRKDKEYGVSRGIDFKNVACVLNFDLPTSSKSYTHRIGRTARAGKTGMALSFVVPSALYRNHKPTTFSTTEHDESVLEAITQHQAKRGKEVKPYQFDMAQVDAFRYRMNDALRAVTGVAIREARTRELREELIKSEKLKRHFEENPDDLYHLRHDGELRAARTQAHLKHVPDYLMPAGGKKAISSGEIGFVSLSRPSDAKVRRSKHKGRAGGKKRLDPLKTFNARGRKK